MSYEVKTKEKVVTSTNSYSYFEIGNYVAFRVDTKASNSPAVKTVQGIQNASVVQSAIKRGTIPTARRFSVHKDMDVSEGLLQYPPQVPIYDYLMNGGDPKSILQHLGYGLYSDLYGEMVPVGIHFSYMNGYTDNGHYDLPKAVEILEAREDITFVNERYSRSASVIKCIPSYNAELGIRDQEIEFYWVPTQEQAKELSRNIDMVYETIFEKDMIGLRAAALYDIFQGSREYD